MEGRDGAPATGERPPLDREWGISMVFDGPEQAFHWYLQARDLGSVSGLDELIGRCPANWGPRLVELERAHAEEAARKAAQLRRVKAQIGAPPTSADSVLGTPEDASSGWRSGVTAAVLERLVNHADRRFRYRIGPAIGRGGMGTVYAAHDQDLRREVALKVIREPDGRRLEPADYEALFHRFLAEAQVTAQLAHPGIVPIHDVGLDPDGRLFYTMPKIEGQSLSDLLAGHRSQPRSLVRILGHVARVCETMEFAHSHGVVHRDLKPANVMVGAYGEVYVLDWGVAVGGIGSLGAGRPTTIVSDRQLALEGGGTSLCTHPLDRPGTPQYMAPEQARGETAAIGPQVDVYGVGAMLYRLLAGMAPYGHLPRDVRDDRGRLLAIIESEPPRTLDDLAPDAPVELVAIAERAMCRDLEQRYSSMTELGRDLRAFVEGRVVHAYERGPWAEARKWVRRNRLAAAGSGVAMVVLVGALVVTSLTMRHSQQLLDLVAVMVQEIENVVGADSVIPLIPGDIEGVLADARGGDELRLMRTEIEGDRAVRRGDYETALAKFTRVLERRRALAGTDPEPDDAEALSIAIVKVGDALNGVGRGAETFALYLEALAIDERLARARPGDPHLLDNLCWSYVRLGDHRRTRGDHELGHAWYGKADAVATRLLELSPERLHSVYARSSVDRRMVEEYRRMERHAEAGARAWRALQRARHLVDREPWRRDFRVHLASCERAVARAQAAEPPAAAFRSLLDAWRHREESRLEPEPDRSFLDALANLEASIGSALVRAGAYEDAERFLSNGLRDEAFESLALKVESGR